MSEPVSVSLTQEQRDYLRHLTRSGNAPARVQTRARILLLADRSQGERRSHLQITESLSVSGQTISTICRRFALEGMKSALYEKPRPGQTPKITGEVEAQLVLLACSDPPKGSSRWTMQMLADKLVELRLVDSISDSAVCDRLKKTRSNPGKRSASA
jgi:transposase